MFVTALAGSDLMNEQETHRESLCFLIASSTLYDGGNVIDVPSSGFAASLVNAADKADCDTNY